MINNNLPNLLKSGHTQSSITLSGKQNRMSPSNSMALVKQDESLAR
jgi:hypothetical protein